MGFESQQFDKFVEQMGCRTSETSNKWDSNPTHGLSNFRDVELMGFKSQQFDKFVEQMGCRTNGTSN